MAIPTQKSLKELLDDKEKRADAATKGPWYQDPTNDIGEWLVGSTKCPVADCDFAELNRTQIANNSAFIAAARSDVPALVKTLRKAVEFIQFLNQRDPTGRVDDAEERLAELLSEPADSVHNGNAEGAPPDSK